MNIVPRLFAFLAITAAPLLAQTKPPASPAPAAPAPPTTGEPTPETPAPAAPPVKERKVYIPFDDLAATLANEGQGVFLPYREFLEMWNQLNVEKEKENAESPADAVLSSVECVGTIEGEAATLTAVVKAESFKEKGWAVLDLGPTSGVSFSKAETGEASLRAEQGNYQLLLPRKGKYELKLEMMARLQRNSGRHQLKLRLPQAPVSRTTLTIPEEGWEFELSPSAAYTTQSKEGATELSFFFGEHEEVTVSWQKAGGESKLTPLIFAEIQQNVVATSGSLQNSLEIDYRILRAGVDHFALQVPKSHEILTVSGDNIKEWNVTPGEGEAPQLLLVTLHSAARDAYHLNVGLESAVESLPADLTIPQITAVDALRQRGTLTISAGAELEAALKDLTGLSQQEVAMAIPQAQPAAPNEAPQQVQQAATPPAPVNSVPTPSLLGKFRYLKLPFTAGLAIKRAEPVVEVTSQTSSFINLDTYLYNADVSVKVTRSGIFDLRVGVPSDIADPEATGPLIESFTLTEADGKKWMDLRLRNRASGAFAFKIAGRRVRESAAQDVTLPVFAFPSAVSHEGALGIFIHGSLDQTTKEPGGLRKVDASELASTAAASATNSQQPDLAYRYRAGAAPAVLSFKIKPPVVTGDSLVLVDLKEQAVHYAWNIKYNISYSSVDTFLISLPKAISAGLRVDTRTVKETEKNFITDPPAPADREIWRITLRDKKMGTVELDLSLEVPLKNLGAGKAVEIDVPELILLDVFQEIGQIAVAKEGNLEVAKSASTAMETVDVTELRAPLSTKNAILAFKPMAHPHALKLSVSKNSFLEVPQAVVTTAVLNTVVSKDGASTTEAIYWVKNNGLQYFSIELPTGGQMMTDVFVNGKSMQPMRRPDKSDVLVKLPSTRQGPQFPVRFLYQLPATASAKEMGASGSFSIEAPKINGASTLRSQVTLHLPRDYVYLDFGGSMRLDQRRNDWRDPHRRFRFLIPAIGPDLAEVNIVSWPAPPALPAQSAGGFNLQLPSDGQKFLLTRLDAPSSVTVGYRSRKLDMSVRFLAILGVFILSLLFIKKPLEKKAVFFSSFGFGSLALRGLTSASWAPFWECVWLGSLAGLGVWFLAGMVRTLSCMAKSATNRPGNPPPTIPRQGSPAIPQGPTSGTDPIAIAPFPFKKSAPPPHQEAPPENLSGIASFPDAGTAAAATEAQEPGATDSEPDKTGNA